MLRRDCPAMVSGGLSKMYAIRFEDLVKIDGDNVYTISDGWVNAIGVDQVKFMEVGLLKDSSKLEETLKRNIQNGTKYIEQKVSIALADLSIPNRGWVENAVGQRITIILKDTNGNYQLVGEEGYLEITDTTGGIGTTMAEFKGYNLVFTGTASTYSYRIDPAIIPDLLGTGSGGGGNVPTFTAYWGWVDDPSDVSTTEDILNLQGSGVFNHNASVTADYRANNEPKYLVMAQPLTEPARIDWYCSPFNQGQIGNPDTDLFNAAIAVGQFAVYISVYPTQQNSTTIKFLS